MKGESHKPSWERRGWDSLVQRSGFGNVYEKYHDHHQHVTCPTTQPPEKDHLYHIIDPTEDVKKDRLFGMAKTFPKLTREGYRHYLREHLKDKASKYDEHDIPEQERQSGGSVFKTSDLRWLYKFKTKYHAEMAEFFAMFVFMLIGFSSSIQWAVSGGTKDNYTTVVLGWGIGNMVGIYIAGGYSGAHLNPVLTFNLWFFRGFPLRRVFQFWIAQFFGALAASAWSFILYYPALKKLNPNGWSLNTGASFFTSPALDTPIASAWFNEVTATAVMHIAIFAVGDSENVVPVRGMNALVLGMTLTAIGSCFGWLSPFGMNPFRDFAPRIFLSMVGFPKAMWYTGHLWWLVGLFTGPMLGGFLGSLAYDTFIFAGAESPINFPVGIKRRAVKAWWHDVTEYLSGHHSDSPHTPGNQESPGLDNLYDRGSDIESQTHGKIQVEGQPAG